MKMRRLRYPVCPKCCYNLSDTPISEDGIYTCSECGEQINSDAAYKPPAYIGNLNIPILVVTLPTISIVILGLLPAMTATDLHMRAKFAVMYALFSPIILFYMILASMFYSSKVARWEGPNDWRSPSKTGLTILFFSCCYALPIYIFFWLLAVMMFLGSSF
jgi:hypothetical protein